MSAPPSLLGAEFLLNAKKTKRKEKENLPMPGSFTGNSVPTPMPKREKDKKRDCLFLPHLP